MIQQTSRHRRERDRLDRHLLRRIINEVRGIHRVVLDIRSKRPRTIEWE